MDSFARASPTHQVVEWVAWLKLVGYGVVAYSVNCHEEAFNPEQCLLKHKSKLKVCSQVYSHISLHFDINKT